MAFALWAFLTGEARQPIGTMMLPAGEGSSATPLPLPSPEPTLSWGDQFISTPSTDQSAPEEEEVESLAPTVEERSQVGEKVRDFLNQFCKIEVRADFLLRIKDRLNLRGASRAKLEKVQEVIDLISTDPENRPNKKGDLLLHLVWEWEKEKEK